MNTTTFNQTGVFNMDVNTNDLSHDSVVAAGPSTINPINLYITLISPTTLASSSVTISNLFEGSFTGDLAQFSIANIAGAAALGPNVGAKLVDNGSGIDLVLYMLSSNFGTLTGMSHNQTEAANAIDTISKGSPSADMTSVINIIENQPTEAAQKGALNQLHGSFLANAIMSAAFDTGRQNLYGRITPRAYKDICITCDKTPVAWAQAYGVQNILKSTADSPGDFKTKGWGAQAGLDIWNTETFTGGVYFGYGDNNLSQAMDNGTMKAYTAGLYGGWFGDKWDVKSSLSAGMENYDTTRNLTVFGRTAKATFDTQSVNADVMAEYKIPSGGVNFKPFIGLQGGLVRNSSFDETGADSVSLSVDSGNYFGASVFGGIGIEEKLNKLRWYGDLHANLIAAGDKNTITAAFSEDKNVNMDIYSAKQGGLTYGAGLGAEYQLSKPLSVYAYVSADLGSGYNGYYGNIGFNYKFCCGKKNGCQTTTAAAEQPAAVAPVQTETPAPAVAVETAPVPAPAVAPETVPPAAPAAEAPHMFPNNVLFGFDKSNVSDSDKAAITKEIERLKQTDYYEVRIQGHTDSVGTKAYNQKLSERRAKAVYNIFKQKGVTKNVSYEGFGKTEPAASNKTKEGRAQNRRVEVIVLKRI